MVAWLNDEQVPTVTGGPLASTSLKGVLTKPSPCRVPDTQWSRGRTRAVETDDRPDHGGCGDRTVVSDPLDRLVADAVLYRRYTPELADTPRRTRTHPGLNEFRCYSKSRAADFVARIERGFDRLPQRV